MINNDSQLRRLARLIEIKEQASKLLAPYITMIGIVDGKNQYEVPHHNEKSTEFVEADIHGAISPLKPLHRNQMLSPVKLRRLLQKPSVSMQRQTDLRVSPTRKINREETRFSTISHLPRNIRFSRSRKDYAAANTYRHRYNNNLSESFVMKEGDHQRRDLLMEPAIEFEVVEDCMRSTAIEIKRRKQNSCLPEQLPVMQVPSYQIIKPGKTDRQLETSPSKIAVQKKKHQVLTTKMARSTLRRKFIPQRHPPEFRIDGWNNQDDLPEECVEVAL